MYGWSNHCGQGQQPKLRTFLNSVENNSAFLNEILFRGNSFSYLHRIQWNGVGVPRHSLTGLGADEELRDDIEEGAEDDDKLDTLTFICFSP